MPDGNKKPHREQLGPESAIALGGASLLSERAEAQSFDAEKMNRTLQNDPFYFERHLEEINFETDDKITPEIQSFVKQLINLQNRIFETAIQFHSDQKAGFSINIQILEQLCREIWELIISHLQINLPYSNENYNYIFLYELPKYLAKFGILLDDKVFTIKKNTNRGTKMCFPVGVFRVVAGKEIEEYEEWNNKVKSPILNVSFAPELGEQKSLKIVDVNDSVRYGNVVLQKSPNDLSGTEKNIFRERHENSMSVPETEYLNRVALSKDQRTQAAIFAAGMILKRNGGINFSFSDTPDRKKTHEVGHIIFINESKNLLIHKPPKNNKELETDPLGISVTVHNEIGALLFEIKRTKVKDKVFFLFLQHIQQGIIQDFQHDEAVNWVFDRMVNLIKRDPFKYGMEIDFESPVSHENQIIMQLAKISANPKWVEELIDEIHEIHLQNLQQGFLAKYYKSQNLPLPEGVVDKPIVETVYEVKKPFPYLKVGTGVVGTGLAIASGIAFNKFRIRKELVRLEERLPNLIKKRNKTYKKYDVKELVNNLQFGASKDSLDLQRRQDAIAELKKIKIDEKIIAFLEKHL